MSIHAASVGVQLNFTFNTSIAAPALAKVKMVRPDGTSKTLDVVIDSGAGGTCHYLTVSGDLSVAGRYRFQSILRPAGALGDPIYGDIGELTIGDKL